MTTHFLPHQIFQENFMHPPGLQEERLQAARTAGRRARGLRIGVSQFGIVISSHHDDAAARPPMEHFLLPDMPNLEAAVSTDEQVNSWFSGLEDDAADAGNSVPAENVINEAKRIVTGLGSYLPDSTDVYTMEGGKIAVELFGTTGRGFLLVCEPNGGALCVVTVDGKSRRARYETSTILPDGFLREGLLGVRS